MLAQSSQTDHSNGSSTTNSNSSSSDSADEDQISIRFADWGFKIDRLFEVAYRFYKRNESKAFHPSFDERNKMIALVMQARYGNHGSGRAPDVGALDFVGQRRQHEWSMLNGMSKTEAMSKFICALDHLCPLFKAHAEAIKISSGIVEGDVIGKPPLREETRENKSSKVELDPQMHNIYLSLCKQTYNQFKGYAEKQYPEDSSKQKYLITSLQEQYYQQYISQMHPELKSSLPNSSQASNRSDSNIPSSLPSPAISDRSNSNNESLVVSNQSGDSSIIQENQLRLVPLAPHFELPLPPKEIQTPVHKTEGHTNIGPDPISTNESIYLGDVYCEDNNVQADISSEELNSDPTANDIPSTHRDTVDGYTEAKLVDKLNSISIEPEKPDAAKLRNQNIKESVRLFRNSDLPPIGVFESFPEPRPIKTTSQKSTPIDQINPNLRWVSTKTPERRATIQETKADLQPTSTNFEDPLSSQQALSLSNPIASQRAAEQKILISQFTSTNYENGSHPTSRSESTGQYSDIQPDPLAITVNEQTVNIADAAAFNMEESPDDASRSRIPELWDYASDGGHSPRLPEVIPYQEPEPATIWSKREIVEFKQSLDNDKQGGIYEVKERTLVIFEVPTYPDGKYIYWEFATDDFDIGFGLEFVYEQQLSEPLALNIYEDADEDDMDDMMEEEWSNPSAANLIDAESARVEQQQTSDMLDVRRKILAEKRRRQGNTISIVPTYRRDSHQEVFVGRHRYPGRGYYLLRFDNTYSVLRSKTLYFRVCYFM